MVVGLSLSPPTASDADVVAVWAVACVNAGICTLHTRGRDMQSSLSRTLKKKSTNYNVQVHVHVYVHVYILYYMYNIV